MQGGEEGDPASAERRQVQPVDVRMDNVELAGTTRDRFDQERAGRVGVDARAPEAQGARPHRMQALRASWNRRSRTGSRHGRARPARRPARPGSFPCRHKVSGGTLSANGAIWAIRIGLAPQLSAALREAAHTSRRPAASAIRTLPTGMSLRSRATRENRPHGASQTDRGDAAASFLCAVSDRLASLTASQKKALRLFDLPGATGTA
jgi:hypothetical protein